MSITHLKSPEAAARWLQSWVTGTLRTDSRLVQPGDGFIAWPGQVTDGRQYVQAALAAGAATCIVELEGVEAYGFEDSRVAALPNLKEATGRIADAYFGRPSDALKVVAVTGTNGKTSSAWWTAQALGMLDRPCGLVGTLGVGTPPVPGRGEGHIRFTGLTTPDPVVLQASFADMVKQGFGACAIEASSIGIAEERMAGTRIAVALFTNFTRDHLDYHGGMAAYWAEKRRLFAWDGLKSAVINVDDAQGAKLVAELAGSGLDLWTVSAQGEARIQAREVGYTAQGLRFLLAEAGGEQLAEAVAGDERDAQRPLLVLGSEPVAGLRLEGGHARPVQFCHERLRIAAQPVVGGAACCGDSGADAAGRVGLPRHAGREFSGTVAVEHEMRVAVDEPGQHACTLQIDAYIRCGCCGRTTDPGDRAIGDNESGIRAQAEQAHAEFGIVRGERSDVGEEGACHQPSIGTCTCRSCATSTARSYPAST